MTRASLPPLAALTVLLALAPPPALAASWSHAHSDAGNSGFLDVPTIPARVPVATVGGIGTYAAGAGPVVAEDGTVYLGDEQGDLRAFDRDGKPLWTRTLGNGLSIQASPVVDVDGSIYVTGVSAATDHRVDPPVILRQSWLFRFAPNGDLVWKTRFPDHGSIAFGSNFGMAPVSPALLDTGTMRLILVPAVYIATSNRQTRLIGFGADGAIVADDVVTERHYDVTGGSGFGEASDIACLATGGYWCLQRLMLPGFSPGYTPPPGPDYLPADLALPMPAALLNGSDIVVTDPFGAIVDMHFTPGTGFTEDKRLTRDGDVTLSAPSLLPNGERVTVETSYDMNDDGTVAAAHGHLLFTGPLETQIADAAFTLQSTPGRTGDGRIVVAGERVLHVLDGQTPLTDIALPADEVAGPAISRNDIFLSTASSLRTLDAATLAPLGETRWTGGGQSSPVIGQRGEVYALAGNTLYVFPAPFCARDPSNPRCHVVAAPPVHSGPIRRPPNL